MEQSHSNPFAKSLSPVDTEDNDFSLFSMNLSDIFSPINAPPSNGLNKKLAFDLPVVPLNSSMYASPSNRFSGSPKQSMSPLNRSIHRQGSFKDINAPSPCHSQLSLSLCDSDEDNDEEIMSFTDLPQKYQKRDITAASLYENSYNLPAHLQKSFSLSTIDEETQLSMNTSTLTPAETIIQPSPTHTNSHNVISKYITPSVYLQNPPQESPIDPSYTDLNSLPHPLRQRSVYYCDTLSESNMLITPPCDIRYVARDTGLPNPRYCRSTMSYIPKSLSMYKNIQIDIGFTITPFPTYEEEEEDIPCISLTNSIRCTHCGGYINYYVTLLEDKQHWKCNLCSTINNLSKENIPSSIPMNTYEDSLIYPQYSRGIYDIDMNYASNSNDSTCLYYVFIISGMETTYENGLFQTSLNIIKNTVSQLSNQNGSIYMSICIYDTCVHFITLNNNHIDQITIDDDNSSIPLLPNKSIFIPVTDIHWNDITDYISNTFINPHIPAGISKGWKALQCAIHQLVNLGGQVFVFSGEPSLSNNNGKQINETVDMHVQKEQLTYDTSEDQSQTDLLLEKCINNSITIHINIITDKHIHMANCVDISKQTGGTLFFIDDISICLEHKLNDLCSHVRRVIHDYQQYDASLCIRTSDCFDHISVYGGIYMENKNKNTFKTSVIGKDTVLGIQLMPRDVISDSIAFIQATLLYTNSHGKQYLRVFNYKFMVTEDYLLIYNHMDMDAILLFMTRHASLSLAKNSLIDVRGELVDRLCTIISTYRKKCYIRDSFKQFVLPETLQLFPLYLNGLFKSPLLSLSTHKYTSSCDVDTRGDQRCWIRYYMETCSLPALKDTLYPSLYCLDPDEPWGFDDFGLYIPPPRLFLCSLSINDSSVYIMSGYRGTVLILGHKVPSSTLLSLFNVPTILDADSVSHLSLIPRGNEYSQRVIEFVNWIKRDSFSSSPTIVLHGSTHEFPYREQLYEDKKGVDANYSLFIGKIHKHICEQYL
ncbi:hypothetical protein WA158_003394 [Blastocystis sp. Blastoise]